MILLESGTRPTFFVKWGIVGGKEVAKPMKSDFIIALTQLAAERNLPRDIVLSAIEAALVSAYKRDSEIAGQDISVKLDPGSGDVNVYIVKTVVQEVGDPLLEITLDAAKKIKSDVEIGEVVATESLPHSAGRIAAQTAKQVVLQRLREAERDLVFQEFAEKEGEVFTVTIQRIEPRHITVELGRAEAIMPPSEQVPSERYRIGMKLKVLLQSIRQSNKGPELIVSRADKLLIRRLFEIEVPEIFNGTVEIVAIAREPGWRSKVGVFAKQDGVDAVGSCVGLRGIRIQSIVNEMHGEKIDVVEWSKDPGTFIANALSPSMVMRVDIDEESGSAVAVVPERQLSLAIGKEGQNARLAARLSGWKVDIKSNVEAEAEAELAARGPVETIKELEISTRVTNTLAGVGIEKVAQVLSMTKSDLLQIDKFGQKALDELYGRLTAMKMLPKKPVVAVEAVEQEDVVVELDSGEHPVEDAMVSEESVEADVAVKEGTVEVPVAEVEEVESEVSEEVSPEAEVVIPVELFMPEVTSEPSEEPVPVGEPSTSIQDLPKDVWAVKVPVVAETGGLRFREDIEELSRSDGPGGRARRRGGSGYAGRGGKRTKARKR